MNWVLKTYFMSTTESNPRLQSSYLYEPFYQYRLQSWSLRDVLLLCITTNTRFPAPYIELIWPIDLSIFTLLDLDLLLLWGSNQCLMRPKIQWFVWKQDTLPKTILWTYGLKWFKTSSDTDMTPCISKISIVSFWLSLRFCQTSRTTRHHRQGLTGQLSDPRPVAEPRPRPLPLPLPGWNQPIDIIEGPSFQPIPLGSKAKVVGT